MDEKDFVDALIKTINTCFPESFVLRPKDQFNLGVPDLLAWVRLPNVTHPWSIAIEAKQLRPLMDDPFHKGRRTGQMLAHPFSGPQISALRQLKAAGVTAMGLVRASADTAFRIMPEDLPAKTGNFTHEEMLEIGTSILRLPNGTWPFWQG